MGSTFVLLDQAFPKEITNSLCERFNEIITIDIAPVFN